MYLFIYLFNQPRNPNAFLFTTANRHSKSKSMPAGRQKDDSHFRGGADKVGPEEQRAAEPDKKSVVREPEPQTYARGKNQTVQLAEHEEGTQYGRAGGTMQSLVDYY